METCVRDSPRRLIEEFRVLVPPYTFACVNESEVREIFSGSYKPPYDIYNLDPETGEAITVGGLGGYLNMGRIEVIGPRHFGLTSTTRPSRSYRREAKGIT